MAWIWLRRGTLKRETESLLEAVQNTRIDNTQKNIKCRLCGDRDETVNHIKSESNNIALKEYESKYEQVGKVIDWELCKKLKFDHAD